MTLDLSVLGSDVNSDDTGASLTYSLVGAASEGSASISGAILTFDPGAAFQDLAAGETREFVLGVQAVDSHGAATNGQVTVTVQGTNDAPVVDATVGQFITIPFTAIVRPLET